MFGIPAAVLALVGLAALGVGGLLYAVFFNTIAQENQTSRRLATVKAQKTDSASKKAAADRLTESQRRRRQVAESLSDLEERNKAREKRITKPSLKMQIQQAGLSIELRTFYLLSIVAGLVITLIAFIFGMPMLYLAGVFFAAAFGLPRWVVSFLRKRRMKQFLDEFPNAIDVIVRAIKSGLPLNDGIRLIANEAREPVRSEFRRIVEAQQLGVSTPDACLRMYEHMPVAEANFFAIVIQIQQQAGGNLSEALGNLSKVLRARKQMKAKVAAMSMEAKASAAIIGALPPIVTVLVYLTSPEYIMLLFTTDTGFLILGVSAIWMSIGIFVMRQMINFEV
ncbi:MULTISPECIES: type II secretion system F family protein [unclassified Roseitalea]|uniref:type II secretion system F family protein n=1 Tax=unclassified Roseitalea TaxID=2639107 RepID=UPI00273E38C0|nr:MULTISPECIES: type II secretion system F family protein [unclassified Roseitalea]